MLLLLLLTTLLLAAGVAHAGTPPQPRVVAVTGTTATLVWAGETASSLATTIEATSRANWSQFDVSSVSGADVSFHLKSDHPETFIVTGLTTGESYMFRLSFINDSADAETSVTNGEATARVLISDNVPVTPRIIATTDTSATLQWHGERVDNRATHLVATSRETMWAPPYSMESPVKDIDFVIKIRGASGLRTVSGLQPNTAYVFRLVHVDKDDAVANAVPGISTLLTKPSSATPPAPYATRVAAGVTGLVMLHWSGETAANMADVVEATSKSTFDDYDAQKPWCYSFQLKKHHNQWFETTGLRTDQTYIFRLVKAQSTGDHVNGFPSLPTFVSAHVPPRPRVLEVSTTTATITWGAVSDMNMPTMVEATRRTSFDNFDNAKYPDMDLTFPIPKAVRDGVLGSGTGPYEQAIATGLVTGAFYIFRLVYVDHNDGSFVNGLASDKTLVDETVPPTPVVDSVDATSATLRWTGEHGRNTAVVVEATTRGTFANFDHDRDSDTTYPLTRDHFEYFVATGLVTDAHYIFRLVSVVLEGGDPLSSDGNPSLPVFVSKLTPVTPQVRAVTATTATLTWAHETADNMATHIEATRHSNFDFEPLYYPLQTHHRDMFVVTDLKPTGTRWQFRLVTVDGVRRDTIPGLPTPRVFVSARMPPTVRVTKVMVPAVTATAPTPTARVTLQWQTPANVKAAPDIIEATFRASFDQFSVQRPGDRSFAVSSLTLTDVTGMPGWVSTEIGMLTPDVAYLFRLVSATVDGGDDDPTHHNGIASLPLLVAESTPPAPVIVSSTATSISVTWPATTSKNDPSLLEVTSFSSFRGFHQQLDDCYSISLHDVKAGDVVVADNLVKDLTYIARLVVVSSEATADGSGGATDGPESLPVSLAKHSSSGGSSVAIVVVVVLLAISVAVISVVCVRRRRRAAMSQDGYQINMLSGGDKA